MGATIRWIFDFIVWAALRILAVMGAWLILGIMAFGPWWSSKLMSPVVWLVFHITWWLNAAVQVVLQLVHLDKLLARWDAIYWRFITEVMPPNALDFKTHRILHDHVEAPWGWRPQIGLAYLELLFWPLVVVFAIYVLYNLTNLNGRWRRPTRVRLTPVTPAPPVVTPPPPAAMPAVAVAGPAPVAPAPVGTVQMVMTRPWINVPLTILAIMLLMRFVFPGAVGGAIAGIDELYKAFSETGYTLVNSPKQLGSYTDNDYYDPAKAIEIANAIKASRGTSLEIQNARVKLSAACARFASAVEGEQFPGGAGGATSELGGISTDQAAQLHTDAQDIVNTGVDGLSCNGLVMSATVKANAEKAKHLSLFAQIRRSIYSYWVSVGAFIISWLTFIAVVFWIVKTIQRFFSAPHPWFRSWVFWNYMMVESGKYGIYAIGTVFVANLIYVFVPKIGAVLF